MYLHRPQFLLSSPAPCVNSRTCISTAPSSYCSFSCALVLSVHLLSLSIVCLADSVHPSQGALMNEWCRLSVVLGDLRRQQQPLRRVPEISSLTILPVNTPCVVLIARLVMASILKGLDSNVNSHNSRPSLSCPYHPPPTPYSGVRTPAGRTIEVIAWLTIGILCTALDPLCRRVGCVDPDTSISPDKYDRYGAGGTAGMRRTWNGVVHSGGVLFDLQLHSQSQPCM